jgi:hypothetical protein
MIGLNLLLQSAGIELKRARLVRHQDNRADVGRSPYELWMARDGRFETYQRIQRKERFKDAEWIISLAVTPLDETMFVGVYRVRGVGTVPAGTLDPVGGHDVTGLFFYDLELDDALKEYAGRLIINWGDGFRSWVQRPDRQDKPVVEIRRAALDPPFPGFTAFYWPIRELPSVPASWRVALSAVSGVYVMASQASGKQYVGSAYGSGGFWSRWEDYYRTGHGGNEKMKLADESAYQVSILEIASSSLSMEEIINMEERWKDKILTRKFGLN